MGFSNKDYNKDWHNNDVDFEYLLYNVRMYIENIHCKFLRLVHRILRQLYCRIDRYYNSGYDQIHV